MSEVHPLDLFEAAWTRDSAPNLLPYIEGLRRKGEDYLCSQLCQIDLERRWRFADPNVERWTARDYFRLPELSLMLDDAARIELVSWEFYVRNRWGDFPSSLSFQRDWPELEPRLGQAIRQTASMISRPEIALEGTPRPLSPIVLDGGLEVGRQRTGDPPPFAVISAPESTRLIVAASTDASISRHQLLVRQVAQDRVCIRNHSQNRALALSDRRILGPQSSVECGWPVAVHLGERLFLWIRSAEN